MIKRPLITEKTMMLAKNGLYTFEVFAEATKIEIAKLIKSKFSVDVTGVKIVNTKSKRKMQRTRKGYFQTSPFKKAMVQVKKGQKIALFETASDEESSSAKATGDKEVTVTTGEGEKVAMIKEKKSLLKGTKVRIEKMDEKITEEKDNPTRRTRQQSGKTKGEKG